MTTDQFERPLKDLRISVTDRCNLRCQYCMPGDREYHFMPTSEILSYEELTRLAGLFVGLGVEKIRLTGGEPLIRRDLPVLIKQLAAIDGLHDLSLTTNGMFLSDQAKKLQAAGLGRITVSLDSLDSNILHQMSGRADLNCILNGLKAAQDNGLKPIKVNCVVVRGLNEPGILDMVEWARVNGFEMRFIEYMDVGTLNQWGRNLVVPAKQLLAKIHQTFPCEPEAQDKMGQVARHYRFLDGKGRFGLINSVTEPFCGGCTRARLSAEGRLYTCLFAQAGLDLKTPLRQGKSDAQILEIIRSCWTQRVDRYSEQRQSQTKQRDRVEMFQIGG